MQSQGRKLFILHKS